MYNCNRRVNGQMTSQSYCSARNTPYFVNRPRSTIYIPLNKRSKFSDRHNKASPRRRLSRGDNGIVRTEARSVSIVIEMTTIVVSIVDGTALVSFCTDYTKIIVVNFIIQVYYTLEMYFNSITIHLFLLITDLFLEVFNLRNNSKA